MKKKGFTLIEIIVAISLIALIGVGSFIGIRLVNKNIVRDKLEQITDKILAAAEVYIETNEETYNQLYNKKNGVVIPLNVLVNEGLLDLSATTLEDKDIEDEYVITALSGGSSTENCVDIRTETSWKNTSSAPIYICTDSNGNNNLKILNPNELNNINNVSREPYYFRGSNPKNYIQLNGEGTKYRIISVETDDSLILYNSSSFGDVFINKTQSISYSKDYENGNIFGCVNGLLITSNRVYYETIDDVKVDVVDVANTSLCSTEIRPNGYTDSYHYEKMIVKSWLGYGGHSSSGNSHDYKIESYEDDYKIHLKPCMKITGGTGDFANPYVLEDKCTS